MKWLLGSDIYDESIIIEHLGEKCVRLIFNHGVRFFTAIFWRKSEWNTNYIIQLIHLFIMTRGCGKGFRTALNLSMIRNLHILILWDLMVLPWVSTYCEKCITCFLLIAWYDDNFWYIIQKFRFFINFWRVRIPSSNLIIGSLVPVRHDKRCLWLIVSLYSLNDKSSQKKRTSCIIGI